ncbi:uncharacterized protein DEA37_0006223, partial [Paragonimus westermani]
MDAPGSPIFGGYNPMDRHVPSPDIFEDNNAQDDWVNYYPDYSGGGQPWSPQADTQPVHEARRQLFPDSPSEGEGQLFTFIYRGHPPRFDKGTKVNCIYVDHEDHYHFVFESSSHNKSRSMQRIIQAGHLDIHQNIPILSTLQPVINWDRFAAYLVRTNSPTICIGQKLIHLATNLKVVPREQRDCATLLRNDRAAKVKYDNIKRKRRIDLMSELVEQNDSRTLNELKTALTYEDRKNLYAEHGQQWKEAAELCIEAYCERLRREQESSLFQHYIQNNNHSRICQHPRDMTRGLIWLDALLQQNNINKDEFLGDLTKVMNKKETRKNAFVIEGPTTTGKSLMLKMICDNYIYGTVQRSGDHSQFFLMNLLNKAIALMEEPRITTLTVNDFKELLGGTPFDIHPTSPDLFSDNAQDEEGWTTYYNPDITENAQQWNTPPPPSSQWHSVRRQLFHDTDRWRPLYGDLVKDLQNWITKNFAAIRLNWQLLIGAPLKDMSDMIETLDKITYLPSYREEWTYTVEAKAHNLQQQSQISRVKWAAENIRDSAIEVPRYTGTLENFLETRAKTYPRTTPAPPINRPGPSRETTTSSDTATTTPRPTRPPHEDRPQVEAPRHVELPGKREEIHIKTEMDAKKPRMAGAGEDE